MKTKQLIIKLLSSKVKSSNEIFENENIFTIILEFSRDAAKELFARQHHRRFLISRVDDVAYIVDQNMQKNKVKMHQKISKKYKKKDVESTIAWLIDRWINTFVNLTTNPNYRDYFDFTNIVDYDDNLIFADEDNDDHFVEDIEKFSKDEIKKALKVVWQDALFDSDFDAQDFSELCEKYNFSTFDILSYHLEEKIKIKIETNENQHQQMMFDFGEKE
ncbi:MAG: hypothetical protein WC253_04580 [Sulfurovaceae bacterium]